MSKTTCPECTKPQSNLARHVRRAHPDKLAQICPTAAAKDAMAAQQQAAAKEPEAAVEVKAEADEQPAAPAAAPEPRQPTNGSNSGSFQKPQFNLVMPKTTPAPLIEEAPAAAENLPEQPEEPPKKGLLSRLRGSKPTTPTLPEQTEAGFHHLDNPLNPEQQPAQPSAAPNQRALIKMPLKIWNARMAKGDYSQATQYSDDEIDLIAEAWQDYADDNPQIAAMAGSGVTLASTALIITIPKLTALRKENQQRRLAEEYDNGEYDEYDEYQDAEPTPSQAGSNFFGDPWQQPTSSEEADA